VNRPLPAPQRILVVDDDPTVADVVRRYLERAGMAVDLAPDGDRALAAFAAFAAGRPDLVILDLMLPGVDGLEVCRRMRQQSADVPIIMLTALGEEVDRIVGLQLGADDYVTKPFSPRELVLRVQSVLRRSVAQPTAPRAALTDGDLQVDPVSRTATLAGQELSLTVREFDLLVALMSQPGVALRRAQLLEQVWGWTFGDQSTITVHIRRLREKIEKDPAAPSRIQTIWGIGYRYEPVATGA
jgi:DNA-binding response OmpR family regulator